jgi:hypothetical protein
VKYKKVSGGQVGRRAKKILGCELCSFAGLPLLFPRLKTKSKCPTCGKDSLRMFDSKAEHGRACELQIKEKQGTISTLTYQPRLPLHAVSPEGKKIKLYTYVCDFSYERLGEVVYEDVKGKSGGALIVTDVSAMKIKHCEAEYEIKIELVGR